MAADTSASAQGALSEGDGVVTLFSGLERAPDGSPRPDPDGAVLRGLGLSRPGHAPNGSLWENSQLLFSLTARDLGQVFALEFDAGEPANVYVAATSAFGLYRNQAGDGWADGMWGAEGGPGTIWKLDAERGYRPEKFADVSYIDTPNQGAGIGDLAFDPWHNQLFVSDLESGLIHRYDLDGQLLESFDHGVDGRSFFVDGESGEDERLDAVPHDPAAAPDFEDCPEAFDSTPECWNYADYRRRVWGLGLYDDPESGSVRLYYAVWGGESLGSDDWNASSEDAATSIWSIGIAEGGWFDPTDIRRETVLPGLADGEGSAPVTDIAFARDGAMIAAERGRPEPDFEDDEFPAIVRPDEARVLRLVQGGGGAWRIDGRYDAGFPEGDAGVRANAGGAVSLGFGFDVEGEPEPERPDGTIWMSVTTLCDPDDECVGRESGERDEAGPAAGLQGVPSDLQEDLALRDGEPSGPLASYIVRLRGAGQVVGDVGGVAIYREDRPDQVVARPAREEPAEEAPEPEAAEAEGADEQATEEEEEEDIAEDRAAVETYELTADLALALEGGTDCEPGTACAMELTIANASAEAYDGPVSLTVSAAGPGATVSAASPGDWTCSESAGRLFCGLDAARIDAGGEETLSLAVQPGAAQRRAELESCAALTWLGVPGREQIRSVQAELNRRGFDAGPADGVTGPRTSGAIEEARDSLDLDGAGDVDGELIEALFGEGAYSTADADGDNDTACAVVNVDVPPAPAPVHGQRASRQDSVGTRPAPGRHTVRASQFHDPRLSAQHDPRTSGGRPMHHPVMSRFHQRFDSRAHNPQTSGIEQYHSIRQSSMHDVQRSRFHDGYTSRAPRMHNPYTSGAW